jgi:predicted flap endonuclease-1-like 5' DNA nuclease
VEDRPASSKEVVEPSAPVDPASDDLTELVHIGPGRARKLKDVGISRFQEVVDLGAAKLDSLLAIDRSMAEAIVEDAESKLGQ